MKKSLALILALVMVAALALSGCGGSANDTPASNTGDTPAASTGDTPDSSAGASGEVQDVTLKVWVPEEEKPTMEKMVESFKAAYPQYNLTVDISITGIDEANSLLKTDADSAADIFQVPSGGITELSTKGLLLPIVYTDEQKALYSEGAITSVTGSDGIQYAVPFTPNTFFMYYDKTMFTEDEIKSLDTMLAKDIDGVTTNVSFPISGSWYIESFFYAAGCTVFGPDGNDPTFCDWNNENGFAAGKYVIDLANNPKFHDDKDGYAMSLLRDHKVGAIFNGTWDAENIKAAMGEDRYAAAPLPTVTINGQACQMRNFGDFKTYAVKSNTAYPKAAQDFCLWICNEENQKLRYEDQSVPPCIAALADDPAIAADPAAAALVAQSAFYAMQPNIPEMNNYWTPAEALGNGIVNKEITEANLQAQLDAFVAAVTAGSLAG